MAGRALAVFRREGAHLAANGAVCDWSDSPFGAVRDYKRHLQSFASFSKVTPKAITRFLFGSITVYLLSV